MDLQSSSYGGGPKVFAQPQKGHVSLGSPLRAILFLFSAAAIAFVLWFIIKLRMPEFMVAEIILAIIAGILISGIRVAAQWEKGVILRLGKFHTVGGPGIMYIIPVLDNIRFIDTRLLVINIPSQKVITKDNVPAQIDGVVFFLVNDPAKAVISIQDFKFAIAQYSQTALRDVVGGLTLDELLSEREQVQLKIRDIVEQHIKNWGLHVDSIRLQDINLPEDLQKMMSRQASAEREKRATITKAEGDKMASVNLAQAAEIMLKSPGAMRLRTLQTIDGLGPTSSNTVIIFPAELNDTLEEIGRYLSSKNSQNKDA